MTKKSVIAGLAYLSDQKKTPFVKTFKASDYVQAKSAPSAGPAGRLQLKKKQLR